MKMKPLELERQSKGHLVLKVGPDRVVDEGVLLRLGDARMTRPIGDREA